VTQERFRLTTDGGSLQAGFEEIAKLFDRAPRRVFFHARDVMGRIFGAHRREWIAQTQIRFGKGRGAMKATPVQNADGTNPLRAGKNWVDNLFFYTVRPKSKSPDDPDLEAIEGEAYTTSPVALLHEIGGTVRPRTKRMLAIPIGMTLRADGKPVPRWRTPKRYREAAPRNELIAADMGRGPLLYAVLRTTKRNVARQGASQRVSDRSKRTSERRVLVPAYRLVRSVQVTAKLKFIETWDKEAGGRARRLGEAMDRILKDVAHGKS
jgi:hypothetical protein